MQVKRFINELMTSNSYILWDSNSHRCLAIDPASQNSFCEIAFIQEYQLVLDYIIITHEHTDHNWGVKSLKEAFPSAKIICHQLCAEAINKESSAYFRLYYDDPNYSYRIDSIDVIVCSSPWQLAWNGMTLTFEHTPGHSMGSVCLCISNMLFTGDTIMPFKPYINKRNGSKELYEQSVNYIRKKYAGQGFIIYPGHGEAFTFE